MSIFDEYRKKNRKEEEGGSVESSLASFRNQNDRTKSLFQDKGYAEVTSNARSQINTSDSIRKFRENNIAQRDYEIAEQNYMASLPNDAYRDAYTRSKENEGVYVSPYFTKGIDGKEKLKYNNDEWNNLSEKQKRKYLEWAQEDLDKGKTDSSNRYLQYAKRIISGTEGDISLTNSIANMAKSFGETKLGQLIKFDKLPKDLNTGNGTGTFDEEQEVQIMLNMMPEEVRQYLTTGMVNLVREGQTLNSAEAIEDYLAKYYPPDLLEKLTKYARKVENIQKQQERNEDTERKMENPLYATFIAPAKQIGTDLLVKPVAGTIDAYNSLAEMNKGIYGEFDPLQTEAQRMAQDARYINESINSGLGPVGRFAYGTSVSAAESAARMYIAGGLASTMPFLNTETTSKVLLSGMMSTAVFNDDLNENLQKGMNLNDAVGSAVAHSIFETLFEELSLDKLGYFQDAPVLRSKKEFIKALGKAALVEGSEEAFTDIANELYDHYVGNYDFSEYKAFKDKYLASNPDANDAEVWGHFLATFGWQVAQSFAGGALSSFALSSTKNMSALHRGEIYVQNGKNVSDADYNRMNAFVEEMAAVNPNIANQLAEATEGGEDARRGFVKMVADEYSNKFNKEIERADSKDKLNVVMNNVNSVMNGAISEDTFNTYNAKLVELGETPADYNTFVQNRQRGGDTTFSDLAYGRGDNAIQRNIVEASKSIGEAQENANLSESERETAISNLVSKVNANLEKAEDLITRYTAMGKTLDSPEIRQFESIMPLQKIAKIHSDAKADLGLVNAAQNLLPISKRSAVVKFADNDELHRVLGKDSIGHVSALTMDEIRSNSDYYATYHFAELLSRLTGAKYALFKSDRTDKQKNGAYDPTTDTTYIDVEAGKSGKARATGGAFTHEFVHETRRKSEDLYQRLKNFVQNDLGDSWNGFVQERMKPREEGGLGLDQNKAEEEVVAEACQRMLENSETFKKYALADYKGAKTFRDKLAEFVTRLKQMLKSVFKGDIDTRVTEAVNDIEGLQKEFDRVLEEVINMPSENDAESVKQAMEGKENIVEEMVKNADGEMEIAKMSDGTIMYSETTYRSGGRSAIANALKEKGHTQAEINKVVKYIDNRLNYIREVGLEFATKSFDKLAKNLEADITTDLATEAEILKKIEESGVLSQEVINNLRSAHQIAYAYVSNGDYPMNIDLQLSCKKRIAYEMIINKMIESGLMGDVRMSGEFIGEINTILAAHEFETQCLGCFVESRRHQMQKWAETFVSEWNQQVEKVTGKKRANATKDDYLFHGENAAGVDDAYAAHLQLEEAIKSGERNRAGNGGIVLKERSVFNKMGELIGFNKEFYGKFLTVEDILTADGLKKLRALDNGNLFSLVKSRYGVASPKILQSFNPYNSEVLNLTFKSVSEMTGNSVAGAQDYLNAAKKNLTAADTAEINRIIDENYDGKNLTKSQRDELLKEMTARKVENNAIRQYLLDIGGNRIQSFSDFMIENVFDMLQIFADMSVRDYAMHGYTKEQICLRLFGMTGAKWNGSWISHNLKEMGKELSGLMPYTAENAKHGITVEVDGEKYVIQFDDYERHVREKSFIQSIGFKDAIAIMLDPRYANNVGTITIGFSDKHIRAMLNSPYFRMVIPYHASGMIPGFAELVGASTYNDYTPYQTTGMNEIIVYENGTRKVLSAKEVKEKGEESVTKSSKGYKFTYKGTTYTVKPNMSFRFNEALQRLGDARAAAQEYVDWCRSEHALNIDGIDAYATFSPAFSNSPTGYDFTQEENYYKLLEDFNVYNSREEIINGTKVNARQEGVKLLYPGDEGGTLSAAELKQYEADLKQTGLFSDAEIQKYVKKAQMTFDELVRGEVSNRNAYYEGVFGKNNEKFNSAYEEIKQASEKYKRNEQVAESKEQYLKSQEKAAKAKQNGNEKLLKAPAGTYLVDDSVRYSVRTEAPPKKTVKAYKLMRYENGHFYPLFIGNNEQVDIGVWYNADSPDLSSLKSLAPGTHLIDMKTGKVVPYPDIDSGKKKNPGVSDIRWANEHGYRFMYIEDKAGAKSAPRMLKQYGDTRAYYNWGINGSNSPSTYALRPGWHFGEVPSMHQIGYGENKDLRADNQVWVEVEMAADVDYNGEARANYGGDIPTHIPVNGYYTFATNPTQKKTKGGNTENDNQKANWYVAGAFKIVRPLSDSEADQIVNEYNKKNGANVPLDWRRKDGRVFNAETMRIEDAKDESIRYATRTLSDGTQYVKLDGNIFLKEDGTEMTPREAYNALVGMTITLSDGENITLVKRIPGKDLYNEFFRRNPTFDPGIDIRILNDEVNRNIIEALTNSVATLKNEPDHKKRHAKNGITTFDTRQVRIADDKGAYILLLSVAKLTDGRKIAYAKKNIEKDDETWKKIQAEEGTSKSRFPNLLNNNIPQSSSNVNTRDGAAVFTEERVDRLLRQYGSKGTPNYAQAYAAYISPEDFLMLTTNDLSAIERESRELNEQELRDNTQEIFLKIEERDGKMVVYGHEGRHRMVALRNQGVKEVAISVIDLATKYTKEITDSMTLSHQIFNEQNEDDFDADVEQKAEITDLIPISYENEDILKRRFTGEHQVMYSSRDSEGRELSKGQQKFFADSKVRDENGNLKVMWHGTQSGGFTTFDQVLGRFFFTDSRTIAESYSDTSAEFTPSRDLTLTEINQRLGGYYGDLKVDKTKNGYRFKDETFTTIEEVYEYLQEEYPEIFEEGFETNYGAYLNLTNPLIVDANGSKWDEIKYNGETHTTDEMADIAKDEGYDGLIISNLIDEGLYEGMEETEVPSTIAVAFESNQIKSVNNTNPTDSEDIRFASRDIANSESEMIVNAMTNDAALVDELGAKQSITAYAKAYSEIQAMEKQSLQYSQQLLKASPSEREVLYKKLIRLNRAITNKTTELTEMRSQRVLRDVLINEWAKRLDDVEWTNELTYQRTKQALERKYGEEIVSLRAKSKAKQTEIRNRFEINKRKKNIETKAKALMKMILSPTEKKHIPFILINPITELLDSIDYWTPAEGRPTTKKSESLRTRFEDFRSAINEYQKQIDDGAEQIELMFDPEFLETVDDLCNSVKGIDNVNDMSVQDIIDLDHTLTELLHLISRGNKMIKAYHYQTINEAVEATAETMDNLDTLSSKTSAKGKLRTRLNAGMADSYAFGRYAGDGTKQIIDSLSKAFEDKVSKVKQAIEFTQEVLEPYKKDLKKWSKETHEFTLSTTDANGNPNKVSLTVGQMMELYLLNKREQARGHIYGGGIRVEDRKGRYTESVKVTEEDVQEIVNYLATVPGAIEVADKLQKYGATTITGWGNEASNLMYGFAKFTEPDYWQIRSDSSALKDNENTEAALNASMYRLQNMGRTKAVKKGANNAIYVGDVFDTWSKTIDEMTSYASILPSTTDAMRWWNSRIVNESGDAVRVKKLLESKLGTDMTRVFTETIKALNGGIMGTDSLESLVKVLTGKAKAAAVAGNLRVVLQQPTAYTRAAAVIEPKYLLKALTMKPNAKEAQEHSAIAWHKAQGFYSNGLAPSLRKLVIGDGSFGENLTEKSLWLAGKADDITWGALWNASKLKVEAENKALQKGSDAYWDEVNKVFSDIINNTQVVDTPLTKSTWMRGNGLGVFFTAFMAEPTKTYSMVMTAVEDLVRNPKSKQAQKTVALVGTVFAVNAAVNALAQALADAARDDDKEKSYWEKYVEKYTEDIKDNLNPLTYIPVVKDIFSLMQGYSNNNLAMQAAQNTVYAVQELQKVAKGASKKTLFGQMETVAKAVSGWTGIPFGNVMRTLNSFGNIVGIDTFRRKKYTNSELGRNIALSINEGNFEEADQYMAELLQNVNGDAKKAQNYLVTYLAENDNEIDLWTTRYIEDPTVMDDAVSAMSDKYSADVIMSAIRKSANAQGEEVGSKSLANGTSVYTGNDINRTLEKGDVQKAQEMIDDVNKAYAAAGSNSTAKSTITTYWKPKYLAASGAERDRILRMLYSLRSNGKQMYTAKEIAKWK